MRCDQARVELSDRLDGPGAACDGDVDLQRHVDDCEACRGFGHDLRTLRSRLRLAPVEPPPDVVGAVAARLREEQAAGRAPRRAGVAWPELARVAAVFCLAFAVGAAAVGVGGPTPARADDLREVVVTGQRRVDAISATVTVTEHGWHPDVPERTYGGHLTYAAPETLRLQLEDRTTYPPGEWTRNDVEFVVDDERAWSTATPACPVAALPDCLPAGPVTRSTTGREPFDAAVPVPLELVVPVAAFTRAPAPADLGRVTIAGREALGTRVTAAQLEALVGGLVSAANLRAVHPTDPADVWLDAELGVPLRVLVRAGTAPERQRWAASVGRPDAPGQPILEWRVTALSERDRGEVDVGPPPVARGTAGAFSPGAASAVPDPGWLPTGMRPHRRGTAGDVDVASWSDGRAWLKIRAHPTWSGGRLFGGEGSLVRRTARPGGGAVYLAEGSGHVLVHGEGVDLALSGSLTGEELLRVADGLGVTGQPVPRDWVEAATTTLAEVVDARPDLLTAPRLDGFDGPAVRAAEGVVTSSWAGEGARGFVLTQRPGTVLGPPMDAVVFGVAVRGTVGRYTPARGELEWVEGASVLSLRSATLTREELLAIAAQLETVP